MSISRNFLCSAAGLLILASSEASAQVSSTEALIDDMIGGSSLQAVLTKWPQRSSFPNNVECRDFDRTGLGTWALREKSTIDLGNWDGAFAIVGPISPGAFVRKGIDLYDVLEGKCAIHAS